MQLIPTVSLTSSTTCMSHTHTHTQVQVFLNTPKFCENVQTFPPDHISAVTASGLLVIVVIFFGGGKPAPPPISLPRPVDEHGE